MPTNRVVVETVLCCCAVGCFSVVSEFCLETSAPSITHRTYLSTDPVDGLVPPFALDARRIKGLPEFFHQGHIRGPSYTPTPVPRRSHYQRPTPSLSPSSAGAPLPCGPRVSRTTFFVCIPSSPRSHSLSLETRCPMKGNGMRVFSVGRTLGSGMGC